MPTLLIAPATAASNSADQTIAANGSLNFGLYTAAGGGYGGDVVVQITRKNPSGTYEPTGVVLSGAGGSQVIAAPGVYRAEKPVTVLAVGVMTD